MAELRGAFWRKRRGMGNKKHRILIFFLLLFCPFFQALAEDDDMIQPEQIQKPTLESAATCEDVREHSPYNPAVVFSTAVGKVYCFSSFNDVPDKIYIYHNWYRADKLTTRKRLMLNPPHWSTYSTVQLREADKGPWRVEISDNDGKVLSVLRFSITD